MKKSKFLLCASAMALGICVFSACYKSRPQNSYPMPIDPQVMPDTRNEEDQLLAEQIFTDVQALVLQAHPGNAITIDYGDTDRVSGEGRMRRGKLRITGTSTYPDSTYAFIVTFDNYYESDNKVEGTLTSVNMGSNSAGQPYAKVTIQAIITKTDGTPLSIAWNRIRTVADGYKTAAFTWDDRYEMTGNGTISRGGNILTAEIPTASPLVTTPDCRWIKQGSIICTLPSGQKSTIDYGANTCDNAATVQESFGNPIPVILP